PPVGKKPYERLTRARPLLTERENQGAPPTRLTPSGNVAGPPGRSKTREATKVVTRTGKRSGIVPLALLATALVVLSTVAVQLASTKPADAEVHSISPAPAGTP